MSDDIFRDRIDNPLTSASELQEIADQRPDLHVAIAQHPNVYPELLEWLVEQGDPEVVAAVDARVAASAEAPPRKRWRRRLFVWILLAVVIAVLGVWAAISIPVAINTGKQVTFCTTLLQAEDAASNINSSNLQSSASTLVPLLQTLADTASSAAGQAAFQQLADAFSEAGQGTTSAVTNLDLTQYLSVVKPDIKSCGIDPSSLLGSS